MRRVIGIAVHRTFGEVVFWEEGRLRHTGRIDMIADCAGGIWQTLLASDEMVVEATANSMAVLRLLAPFVARVIIANPLQVKAIAQAHVKTDKSMPPRSPVCRRPGTCRRSGRLTRRRNASVGWWLVATRSCGIARGSRNEVHSILHAHLIPKCPHADLFNARGRAWLAAPNSCRRP
ncbi:hypothetical protein GGD65_004166 [Bradyrhizobium sp. CIR18]|uniref:hypothetical protein n=1 Tax=Bradyrhizobium sp. CIR18 TaxID=2663839 RepID=UPI0017B620BB|nr:hypothetical protein [Bradyrhizobium sp. CIR18]MBB4363133.1 hypothetical protein [Bradyrhizobium sp. CIR18]